MDFFGITGFEPIACESCGKVNLPSVLDVHHCVFKSQGGGNNIENLLGLCRDCHEAAHSSSTFNQRLIEQVADLPERLKCYELSQRMINESM